jgi:hypothetical protein
MVELFTLKFTDFLLIGHVEVDAGRTTGAFFGKIKHYV